MKTDSQRQAEYQRRRRQNEARVTVWVTKEVERGMDVLRGTESRTTWINRATIELIMRQVLEKPFPFSRAEINEAARRGRERDIALLGARMRQ